MKSNSVSVGAGASRAVAATPTPLTVSEARKFLAMDAPQITSLPGMTSDKGNPTRRCVDFVGADFYDAVELAGNEVLGRDPDEDNDASFKTFDDPIASIGERLEATGKLDVLKRVLVKAVVDSEAEEVKNRAAFVIARCKKGAAAIRATMDGSNGSCG